MAVGLYDWALIVDHRKQTVSLLSHRDVQARLAWLEAQRPATAEHFMLTSGWHSNMSAAEYAEKFSRVQAYLHSGDCYQVNLAQRFRAAYRETNGRHLLASMPAIRPRLAHFYALNTAPSSAFRLSVLFIWLTVLFRPARSRAPCRALPMLTPTASRRRRWRPRRKIALKT